MLDGFERILHFPFREIVEVPTLKIRDQSTKSKQESVFERRLSPELSQVGDVSDRSYKEPVFQAATFTEM